MHMNKSLPPIGVAIVVKQNNNLVRCIRKDYVSSSDSYVSFYTHSTGKEFKLKRGDIEWAYT